jgi:DNA invertase Pin-like site-specific DNA recombinase
MAHAISYLRVSTDRQGKSGLGIEAQRDRIARFAAAEGFELVKEFAEVETGKGSNALERRPILQEALAAAKRLKAPVIVAKLDRLSRDTHFVSGLMTQKVKFIVTELGLDVEPFMLHIYAAVAEEERRKISQRTKDALAAKKRAGGKLGNAATLVQASKRGRQAQAEEAHRFAENVRPIIAAIQATGAATLRGVAVALNARGVRTARGGAWHAVTVANILKRDRAG